MSERIHHLLDRWLAEAPQRAFIYLPGEPSQPGISFAELGQLTDLVEAELRALDVRPGDRVLH